LHKLISAIAHKAYERGYKDAKEKKPADADSVKVSMANIRRIKLT
jgi:hypothetical protein